MEHHVGTQMGEKLKTKQKIIGWTGVLVGAHIKLWTASNERIPSTRMDYQYSTKTAALFSIIHTALTRQDCECICILPYNRHKERKTLWMRALILSRTLSRMRALSLSLSMSLNHHHHRRRCCCHCCRCRCRYIQTLCSRFSFTLLFCAQILLLFSVHTTTLQHNVFLIRVFCRVFYSSYIVKSLV